MVTKWSLDELYTSFDSEDFKKDMEMCDKYISDINKWTENNLASYDNATKKIEDYIKKNINLNNVLTKLMSFANLTSAVDAKNTSALQTMDTIQLKMTRLTKPYVTFQKWLNDINNIEDIINSSNLLKKHEFYIKEIIKDSKYLLSEKEEVLISKLSKTGSDAWSNLQNVLSSTLLVDINIDGENKKLPLPVVRNMAYDKDKAIRKKAYEAELRSYKKIEDSSAGSLNGIKGEVITVTEMRGYNNPLEKTIIDSRIDKSTLDAMISAIEETLPSFHKYFTTKGKLLGHNNGLPFYDLFAPLGGLDMKFSYQEAREFIVKNFKTFSNKLANYADYAFENKWIDSEPREGKRGGAFCSNLHPIKESRILTNFTGGFNDVTTLAHELGHGYHGFCLKDESILNTNYPMPIAETASIFCETIIVKAALNSVKENETFTLLEQSISDAGQVIVDIYSRFIFESEIFKLRKKHSLSVDELKNTMLKAQKKAYGNGLDHNYLHPYMWVCKPHYYSASLSFYNFPYSFGLLFAKGLYAEYLKNEKNFVKKYDALLKETGKKDIVSLSDMMGINIRDKKFWENSLSLIEDDIKKFINLSEKKII